MKPNSEQRKVPAATLAVCNGCLHCAYCVLAMPLADEHRHHEKPIRRRIPLAAGRSLFRRNTAFASLFHVCSGALKTQRETPDGTLLVTGLFLPGDVLGIEAIATRYYTADALATADTEVCQLNFDYLLSHCAITRQLNDWLIGKVGLHARRKDIELSWSAGLGARERVLRFFLDLHERLSPDGSAECRLNALPMRKQDIARYLNMSPETLSRSLTLLRHDNLLRCDQDRFTLPDAERARRMTRL